MRAFIIAGVILAIGVSALVFATGWHGIREAFMEDRAVRSERLFRGYGDDVFRLAQTIEWGDAITARNVAPVQERINDRFGDEVTFLFHALASSNIPAVEALLSAGADVTMVDKPSEGSTRDFAFFLASPGGDLLDQDGINELIRLYLEYGGDPNYRLRGDRQVPLISEVALMGNAEGMRILLDAGADPWANLRSQQGEENNAMTRINNDYDQSIFMNELIDHGYFDDLTQRQLAGFFGAFGGYAQRGDEISVSIQQITMRILKRNPHYIEEDPDWNTGRIFRNHWQETEPGVIPWDVINSDAVR